MKKVAHAHKLHMKKAEQHHEKAAHHHEKASHHHEKAKHHMKKAEHHHLDLAEDKALVKKMVKPRALKK